jgi:hypothetical protein
MNAMYYTFVGLTVAAIISQTIHTWMVFFSFSRLTGFIKQFQAIIFCGILSVAIFAFVIIEKPYLALLGAVIEIIINIYYYSMDFFENGIRARVHRTASILGWWRKNYIGLFFGFLIPILIYIFALQLTEL